MKKITFLLTTLVLSISALGAEIANGSCTDNSVTSASLAYTVTGYPESDPEPEPEPEPDDDDVHVNPAIYGYSIDGHIGDSWVDYALANSDEKAQCLVDGQKDTKWCIVNGSWPMTINTSGGLVTNYHPFIQIGMDKKYVLTHYQLTEGADTYKYPNRNWATWEVYGSNDWMDDDSWVLISEESNAAKTRFRAEGDETDTQYTSTYEVDNTKTAYQYYMFIVGSVVAPESEDLYVMQMAKLNLYGYDPTVKVPGDLSGDKKLDTSDLTGLRQIILGETTNNANADINQDGKTNVVDVTTLIHILKKQ